ncbi:unnamed protein product, partial [Bubo scandiacus]
QQVGSEGRRLDKEGSEGIDAARRDLGPEGRARPRPRPATAGEARGGGAARTGGTAGAW